ncbi:hypothetical protein V8E54_004791 [Elaphomyces granulatus]
MHGIRLQRHASNPLQETPCRSFAARIPSTDVSRGICAHIYNIAVQAALKAIRSNPNEHRHYSSTRRTKLFFLIITTNDLPSSSEGAVKLPPIQDPPPGLRAMYESDARRPVPRQHPPLETLETIHCRSRQKNSTGHTLKFDTWLPTIKAKLRVDGEAIGDSVAQFYSESTIDSSKWIKQPENRWLTDEKENDFEDKFDSLYPLVLPQLSQAEESYHWDIATQSSINWLLCTYDNPNKQNFEPFGIEIYAAVDAYSRYIIWTYAGISARTVVSVPHQYLTVVLMNERHPRFLRS